MAGSRKRSGVVGQRIRVTVGIEMHVAHGHADDRARREGVGFVGYGFAGVETGEATRDFITHCAGLL